MATDVTENAERWAHELIAAFERDPIPRLHNVVNVTVARWALALQADNERLRERLDAKNRWIDKLQAAHRAHVSGGPCPIRGCDAPEGATDGD